jgi:hypothetical protein
MQVKTSDFIDLVKSMRKAQNVYSRTGTPSDFAIAKSFEEKVDKAIEENERFMKFRQRA